MKKILLTGGRSPAALELARQLHLAGHHVSIAETSRWHVCRFSKAVSQCFLIPSPRFAPEECIESLVSIVEKHRIDMLIPIYEEILYISSALKRFPSHCQVFSSSFSTLHQLHNKWLFNSRLKALGLLAPQTYLIKTPKDLLGLKFSQPYALKACYSRASQKVIKVDPQLPLPYFQPESHNPWIAQEWLEGKKYCSYSICHEGSIKAHGVYPVGFAIEGKSCLNFEAIQHPRILEWVENFVRSEKFTGQIAFDFIECPGEKIYAIECNPRATSGVHLFHAADRIDHAFFNLTPNPIFPKVGSEKQIAFGMMLYGWKGTNKLKNLARFFKKFLNVSDVVFSSYDIKPFFAQLLIFPFYWIKCLQLNLPLPAMFTFDVDWNGDHPPSGEEDFKAF